MCWIALRMKAGDHNGPLADHAVEEPIWKPTEKGATGAAMKDWKPVGILGDCPNSQPKFIEELVAEPRTL